jgi:hypothetical protein
LKVLQGILSHEELGSSIEVEDIIKVGMHGLFQWNEFLLACVGDNNINLTKISDYRREEFIDILQVGDIRLESRSSTIHRLDLLYEQIGSIGAMGIVDGYRGPFLGQFKGNPSSNATGSSCNESHFAGKFCGECHDWISRKCR